MISDVTTIRIEKAASSRLKEMEGKELQFGRQFTDHMFMADFIDGQWKDPRIVPFGNISLSPATSFIHYGQSIFEGLKAHKGDNGEVLMFRPLANLERMNRSAERMCMASVPEELYMEAITHLLKLDLEWMPNGEDSSMYIRPFMFGSEPFLGVKPSASYTFMVILSPSGKYYSKPVKVKIETEFSRAMKGGVGSAKTSGNYAASLYPAKKGFEEGYDQLIWTDAKDHEVIEESGTMNIMFVLDGKVITPQLSTSILPGITRDSILTIARDWGYEVEERDIHIAEIIAGASSGALTEAFGVGTAATIAQIETIGYKGNDFELSPVDQRPFSNKMAQYLNDYKRGRVEDKYGWLTRL